MFICESPRSDHVSPGRRSQKSSRNLHVVRGASERLPGWIPRAALAVERRDCPNCDAPAGSACRTRGGKIAAKHHTPRFVLVPALRGELEVLVPADRHPGRAWKQGPALAAVPAPSARSASARTFTARQELASQLEALHRAQCHKVFQEQISTRVKVRPELEAALAHPAAGPVPANAVREHRGGRPLNTAA